MCPSYAVHQYLLARVCCCSLCGRTCAELFLGLKELLTGARPALCMREHVYERHYTLVNNLYLVGRLYLSLQILNLMMQAQAEQQRGRLISGLRPLIILQTRRFVFCSCSFYGVTVKSRKRAGEYGIKREETLQTAERRKAFPIRIRFLTSP